MKNVLKGLMGESGIKGLLCATALAMMLPAHPATAGSTGYRSPMDVAYSPNGEWLAISDHTMARLYIARSSEGEAVRSVELHGNPTSVVWRDEGVLLVGEYDAGTVAEVDAESGSVLRRLEVGPKPVGVAACDNVAVVTEFGLGLVQLVDLDSGEVRSVAVRRQPYFAAMDAEGEMALVGHLIPDGPSIDPNLAATVSLIRVESAEVVSEIELPDGSSNVRGVAISPDGRWGYVVHTRGRVALPTTQLERGWVNTNALSVIDMGAGERLVTVLLDYVTEGAADPWGITVSGDGSTAWISLAGAHQVARVDLAGLHSLISGGSKPGSYDEYSGSSGEFWTSVQKGEKPLKAAENHLAALYGAGVIDRERVGVRGPRGIDVSPDGSHVAVGGYYSGDVLLVGAGDLQPVRTIHLGPQESPDPVRLGEAIFHDADYCFQSWLTCSTCHPGGRADGLNWDLLNDGIGNPKNTKSLVKSGDTPPVMVTGVRPDMETAVTKGFMFALFQETTEEELDAVRAYLQSLEPEQSPYLVEGELSELAAKGREIHNDSIVGCGSCHPGPLYTDKFQYDVGTRHELDRTGLFDTSTSIELWRTGPFLHDGSAATLREVLTTHNPDDRHGRTSHLTEDELAALEAYLLSHP